MSAVLRWAFFVLCLPFWLMAFIAYAAGLAIFLALDRAGNYLFDR
jgi:hypothetical protein